MTLRHRLPRAAVLTAAATLAVAGVLVPLASASSTGATTFHGCVAGTSRTMEHVYLRSSPPPCPKGSFTVTWASGTTPPAPTPQLTHKALTLPAGPVVTGGSFTANKTLVDTLALPAGTYMVTLNFKAAAVSGTGVAPQMFAYNGPQASDFSNDLFNVGSGDLQPAGTGHDGYYSGTEEVTVPGGGETLDFYAFGYDSDTGAGSYTLEAADVTAVLYPNG